ncbi:mRNA surveillance protein pelota [Candidatus Micrarchaeota archaeon]|nr:mRNA surveillance protein pelota [Candidatus Micrarchaeota archaeon]
MKAQINKKEQTLLATPEGVEDLWYLEKVITPGAMVSGKSLRLFRPRPDAPAERKPVYITIEAEKVEFSKYGVSLRVTGRIASGRPEEFVQVGQYHTIEVKPNNSIKIKKEFNSSDLNIIKTALSHSQKVKLGIVVLDDEFAVFSKVLAYGTEDVGEVYSHTSKRDPNYSDNFIKYISEVVKMIETVFPEGKVIVGGPGFTKDALKKYIEKNNNQLLERTLFVNTSVSGRAGVNEVVKNSLSNVVKEHQLAEEARLLNEAMMHIGKDDGLCVYGIEKVKLAMDYGAIDRLLVHEELIKREDVQQILTMADKKNVNYVLFSSDSDSGRKLKGFGGLVAVLRFKI